ncbi:MAG: hypothetical protein HKN87_06640 [Saprospiraceae bacterium]|nr:hypothetical protein [Saprospiraceae bacterium]
MDELREVAAVVSKNKIKEINTLDYARRGDRVFDFYEKILSNQFTCDQEAFEYYYNNPAQRAQYRKLKAKLRDRLFNTLFFIDVNKSKFSDAQKAFYQCHKDLMVVKLLSGRYARKAAISLATRTLQKSKKFELTAVSIELLRFIKRYHALYTGDLKSYNKALIDLRKHEHDLQLETKAVDYYEDIHIHYRKNLHLGKKVRDRARMYIAELEKDCMVCKTFLLNHMTFSLIGFIENIENNLSKVVENCDRAIRFFNGKPYVSPHFVGGFYYNKLLSISKLGDYGKGNRIFTKCRSTFERGTLRWYKSHEYYFILCMHTGRYAKGPILIQEVCSTREFKYQNERRIERWRIYSAYVHYLQSIGKLMEGNDFKKFRLNKFLNEVPKYSADKRGYNVPVLVIQILFLIQEGKYDQLSDRIEAIEKYTFRYLKKDNNFRTNCFIKMLLQVPKRHFHRVAVERHANPYLEKLNRESVNRSSETFEIEIIPYEHLWEYVVESLDKKFH